MADKQLRASALAGVAKRLVGSGPDRAARAAAAKTRASALATVAKAVADVAKTLAATDPDRAERAARSMTSRWWMADKRLRVAVLVGVAKVLAASDPDRAARLIAEAERIAHSIIHPLPRVQALAEVATRWPPPTRTGPNASRRSSTR